jgi:ABC-type transport system substrate-binding protein
LAFWHWTDDTIGKAVQVIQNQLGQIGIKLNLTELDIGTMVAQLPTADNNLEFTDVGWPEADILYILTSFGWGVGRYQPKDYMDLLKQARETSDLDKRKEFYSQAQKLFLEDLPWVPLWSPVAAHAVRQEVKNFALGAYGSFVWEDVFIES